MNSRDRRRAPGALESEVMSVLWEATRPLSPAEVQEQVSGGLAYNTVQTILARLLEKGQVGRAPVGRGYAYRPVDDAATVAARRMAATLAEHPDRRGALLTFAQRLEPEDANVLRAFFTGRRQHTPA